MSCADIGVVVFVVTCACCVVTLVRYHRPIGSRPRSVDQFFEDTLRRHYGDDQEAERSDGQMGGVKRGRDGSYLGDDA